MSLELEYLRYSELPFYKHFTELKGTQSADAHMQ